MKYIFLFVLILSSFSLCSQHNFKPKWKKGDSKRIFTNTVEQKFENDSLVSEEIINSTAKIKVVKNNKDHYLVEIRYKNHAMYLAKEFYEKLGEELKEYENYTMVYSIDKETGEHELQNWEEVSEFILNSINQTFILIDQKAPEASGILELILSPIVKIYSSKSGIEMYVEEQIGIIFSPYNQNFELGKPIVTISEEESPFDPSKKLSTTTSLTLLSVNKKDHTCQIKQEIEMDITEFVTMVNDMLQKMMEGFQEIMDEEKSSDDKSTDEMPDLKMDDLKEFEIEMINNQSILYNIEQSWVTKTISTGIVTTSHPVKGNSRTEIIRTIVIE